MKNKAAVELGRMRSEAKAKSSRENGKLGGRPRRVSESVDGFGIPLFEDMASYDYRDTGLPMNVVILSRSGESHGPRIKIQQNYAKDLRKDDLVSVTISGDPVVPRGQKWLLTAKDFRLARKFVLLNLEILLKYWNGEMLTRELELEMKKV
jgi:hypothetical protein